MGGCGVAEAVVLVVVEDESNMDHGFTLELNSEIPTKNFF